MYAVVVGFSVSGIINYKIISKVAKLLRVSKKFGDDNVWSYVMNSAEPTEWAIIRDKKNDLMYEGWIAAFSESTDQNELFIRDVKVYKNSTGEQLQEVPAIYLARERKHLVIEFPNLDFSDYIKRDHKMKGVE